MLLPLRLFTAGLVLLDHGASVGQALVQQEIDHGCGITLFQASLYSLDDTVVKIIYNTIVHTHRCSKTHR